MFTGSGIYCKYYEHYIDRIIYTGVVRVEEGFTLDGFALDGERAGRRRGCKTEREKSVKQLPHTYTTEKTPYDLQINSSISQYHNDPYVQKEDRSR